MKKEFTPGPRQFSDLTVEKMVDYAENHLTAAAQWKRSDNPGSMSHAMLHTAKADAVIEMLEWRLHGKHGAVDEGQTFSHSLRARLDWVRAAAGMSPAKLATFRTSDDKDSI